MARMALVIGNRNYSSWSLRAWLMLRHAGCAFEEILIPLGRPDTADRIGRWSPSGRVPVLMDGEHTVWESLAIGEYLAERLPEVGLWPDDVGARARARCVSHEMHAGFATLRLAMPMNACAHRPGKGWDRADPGKLRADIDRIQAIWREARETFGGRHPKDDGFLFGRFSIADAMYAPVVLRFLTYGVDCESVSQAYVERIRSLPALVAWIEAAGAEPMVMEDKEL